MKHLFTLVLSIASLCSIAQSWEQVGYTINGAAEEELFGAVTDISSDGNRIAIGTPGVIGWLYACGGIVPAPFGAIRVFDWDGGSWNQVGEDILGDFPALFFGTVGSILSMSHDGNTIAYTILGNDTVMVKTWNGIEWANKGNSIVRDIPTSEITEYTFGNNIDLDHDGNTLIIGHPITAEGSGGRALVYVWNGSSWEQKGAVIQDLSEQEPGAGWDVSITHDGNTVAVSHPYYQGPSGNDNGYVRIYEWNLANWEQKGLDIYGESFQGGSGASFSISGDGNTIAIGEPDNNSGSLENAGHVRIHHWNGNEWDRKGLDINGTEDYERLGINVSLSADGNLAAIGSQIGSEFPVVMENNVYRWNPIASSWEIEFTITNEYLVESNWVRRDQWLNTSADGNTIVIGSHGDYESDYVGSVRVFGNPQPQGVNEPNELAVALTPNPSSGIFTVNLPDQINIQASVFDALGKLVATSNEKGTFNLDLSEVPVGIYTLRLDTESGLFTRKLVKR
jgi:hypothetical protein